MSESRPPQERRRANEKETRKLSPTDRLGLISYGTDESGQFFSTYLDRDQPNSELVYVTHANGDVSTYPIITDKIYKEYRDTNSGYAQKVHANPETTEGQATIEKANYLVERDRFIEALRVRRAKELAGGDPLLEHVLHLAFKVTKGYDPDPYVKNGIALYEVNQNASHGFYLGVKDGRLYRYSSSGELVVKDVMRAKLGLADNEPLPNQISQDVLDSIITSLTEQAVRQIQAEDGHFYRSEFVSRNNNQTETESPSTSLSTSNPEDLLRFICTATYEQFDSVVAVCKQRWGDTFKDHVTAILNQQTSTTPKIPALLYQLSNDPIDVTDERQVYLGRGGYVTPETMHGELETSLKIISD